MKKINSDDKKAERNRERSRFLMNILVRGTLTVVGVCVISLYLM